MIRFTITLSIVCTLILSLTGCSSQHEDHGDGTAQQSTADIYTCPMHPSVVSNKPGACPICGMTLVKRSAQKEMTGKEQADFEHVALSQTKQVLANVATTDVRRMRLKKEVYTVGKIDYAEPLFVHISTRFPGRLEKLYLNYTGQTVKVGDPVADVYSPEAISAQREFLLAHETFEQTPSADEDIRSRVTSLLEESKQKLLLWGFTTKQIEELERTRNVQNIVTIYSPVRGTVLKKNVDPQHYTTAGEDLYDIADLSTVWLYLDVYEQDLHTVALGQKVEARTAAFPGELFVGTITFISPTLDPSTRTTRIRAVLPNHAGKLKPETYMETTIATHLPEALVVPSSAVILTGRRTVVWVETNPGIYEARLVTLGHRAGEYYVVLKGLQEHDRVVSSGGYLIDSESQLQASTGSGHQHD
ncbi:MAG: efflux RND transporter periplasmic adaptor subunit [Bacteroidota bacterium]